MGSLNLKRVSQDHSFAVAVCTIICAIFLFDVQGAIIKQLGGRYAVPEISMFRNFFGMGPSLLALYLLREWRDSERKWVIKRLPLAFTRGVFIAIAQLCFYFSLVKMELATATTLAFAGPLFVTSLSIPLLGHKVGLWRTLAVIFGFFGVLLVMRPDMQGFSGIMLLPVCAAFFYALVSVTARFFDPEVPSALINLYSTITSFLIMLIVTVVGGYWTVVPFGVDWFWLVLMGSVGGLAVLLMITAYRMTEPSSLSPFEYFGIPFSFILGYVFFAEAPFERLFPGVFFIAGAGLLVLWREKNVKS